MSNSHQQATSVAEIKPYARAFVDALHAADVRIAAALPESLLQSIYVALAADDDITYVRVSNEADLPGIVAGAYLGGVRAIMISENSGLRQACEPIARLAWTHQLPLVMVVSYRGQFGETNWWGHNHAQVMKPLLDALRIPFWIVDRVDAIEGAIKGAFVHADASQWPVCLVLTGECSESGAAA